MHGKLIRNIYALLCWQNFILVKSGGYISPMDRRWKTTPLPDASRLGQPSARPLELNSEVGGCVLDGRHAQIDQGIGNPHDQL
jgi:hypothetical protein